MNGFKNSTRMRSGFSYPSSAGFTSSTGKMQNISYSRKTPRRGPAKLADGGPVVRPGRPAVRGSSVEGKGAVEALRDAVMPKKSPRWQGIDAQVARMDKAKGGKVDSSLHSFKDDSQLNVEHGPSGGLRPGFTRGGYASKYAKGGWIKGAIKHPGAFTAKAKRAGESVSQYAKQVTKKGSKASTQTKRQANLAKTLKGLNHCEGGEVARYAKGGRIPSHKVAAMEARKAVAEHVGTPAPRGHKGLGSKLKGC